MSEDYDDTYSQQVAAKVRKAAVVGYDENGAPIKATPLSQIDGGEWGTDELDDKSAIRAKMGWADRALPPEPPSDRLLDGEIRV